MVYVKTTITLPSQLIDELIQVSNAKSKADAVIRAIRDEIRLKKIENIKAMAGVIEFTKTAEELRYADERLG